MNRLLAFGLGCATTVVSSSASAQIAVREQLDGYLSFGASLQSSGVFFNANGDRVDSANVDVTLLPLYAEIGLIDRWLMLTLDVPLYRRNELVNETVGVGGATSGLGDVRVGLWTTIFDGPVRILGAAHLGLPTGDPSPEGPGDPTLDTIAELLPTGDGETDVELTLAVARSLELAGYPLRHYAKAQAGYWIRTEGFSDAVNYAFEVGSQLKVRYLDRLWLVARASGSESFADLEDLDGQPSVGLGLGNGVSYTFLGGEALVRLPAGFGLGARVDVPLRGRLVLDAPTYRFYASFEF